MFAKFIFLRGPVDAKEHGVFTSEARDVRTETGGQGQRVARLSIDRMLPTEFHFSEYPQTG